jgi:hypothetical protein
MVSDFIRILILLELVAELSEDVDEAEVLFELAAQEVRDAVRRSFEGSRLIRYRDLPQQWRNNPFVTRGYRSDYLLLSILLPTYLQCVGSFRSIGGPSLSRLSSHCITKSVSPIDLLFYVVTQHCRFSEYSHPSYTFNLVVSVLHTCHRY